MPSRFHSFLIVLLIVGSVFALTWVGDNAPAQERPRFPPDYGARLWAGHTPPGPGDPGYVVPGSDE